MRRRVGIEITFDVRRRELPFVPGIALANDQGSRRVQRDGHRARAGASRCDPGGYISTAWIPGNLLNEGSVVVSVALGTFTAGGKTIRQAAANDAVAFQVIDPGEGGTARGDYAGHVVGARPAAARLGCQRHAFGAA